MMETPRCLNVVSHISPEYGGVATSVPPFCEALETGGRYRSPLVALCADGEDATPAMNRSFEFKSMPMGRLRWALDSGLRWSLGSLIQESSVVHIHGIWQEHCTVAIGQARKRRKPIVISAHGMLDGWALDNKRWKKRAYLNLRHRRDLQRAACLRALTRAEAEDYRRVNLRGPIAVIPNGVAIPGNLTPAEFFGSYPTLRDKRLLLFLGRLHYKKGIKLLAEAWAKICGGFPEAHLVFAGPDSENSRQALLEAVDRMQIGSRVTFTGPLKGTLKWSALAAAQTFVLPSYSEGFSIAALEAMAAGRSVILSRQCHFPEIAELDCGWIIEPELKALEEALSACLSADTSRLQAMGGNGLRLARTRYNWASVAGQMADVCDWLGGGAVPPSTELLFD